MRLKEIRLSKGISVPKLVELSGVPRRTIQDIEKRDDCMVSTAARLAEALEVGMDQLCAPRSDLLAPLPPNPPGE